MRKIDLSGHQFGNLKAIEQSENHCGRVAWKCICDCGNIVIVTSKYLIDGTTSSCGCLRRQITGNLRKTHGMSKTRLYKTWKNMKTRCDNFKCVEYKDYGGRGIKYCNEWQKFISFYEWAVSNGYKSNLTIDRIDVNGNYEPSNCRWATNSQQAQNIRKTMNVTYNGITKTIHEWSKETGIRAKTLYDRNKFHTNVDFLTPTKKKNPV